MEPLLSLLITLLLVILVAGVIVWAIRLLVPALGLPQVFVTVLTVLVVLFAVIYIVSALLPLASVSVH